VKKRSDKKVIYAARIGNFAIAVMKFIVAAFSCGTSRVADDF
jgi:hypothetical protein